MRKKWFSSNPKKSIVDVSHRLYDERYLVATSGNISIRQKNGFLITPSDTRKDGLCPRDIVLCNQNGQCSHSKKQASSEWKMHHAVYTHRNDIHAAIHAHPHYCLACSLAEIPLTEMLLPEMAIHIGSVPIVPYAMPGSNDMADVLIPFIHNHNAFLLQRHGVLVIGENMLDAFNRLEHLEHMARVVYLLSSMGSIEPMTKTELQKLSENARALGQKISRSVLHLLD